MKHLNRMTAFLLAMAIFMGISRLSFCTAAETELVKTEETIVETIPETAENAEDPDAPEWEEATQPVPQETGAEEEAQPLEKKDPEPAGDPETPAGCTVEIPVFHQESYPDVPFGSSTVAENGGSVTVLAMAASYLTGYAYTPDVLAGYFSRYADDDAALLERGAAALGLPIRKAGDFDAVFQCVEEGCIAICQMNNQSVFTDDSHLILLTEVTPEGRIYVSDPSKENQEKSVLQTGFQNGFPKGWISTGWAGGWILDPRDVPEEISLYTGEKPTVHEMPLYNQLDYPNDRYGAGTIATSGCGITSLAMVATYMTGHTYYPDELADYFGGYNGNNTERLLNASDELQLPWHTSGNWHQTLKALKEGKVAILLMNSRSMFANSQHFLVAAGVTEEGKVRIYDPYGPNYSNPVLKDGFANGFTSGQIATGYSGSWIYDVDQMPEEPFIYVKDAAPYIEPRYGDLTLSDQDMELLARVIWVEAQGEVDDGQQAVAEVILNRVYSDRFPNTVHDVVYAENQFRSTRYLKGAKPTQTQYDAIERALYGPYILPMDVTHFATYAVNKDVWGTIGGHTFCYQWGANP